MDKYIYIVWEILLFIIKVYYKICRKTPSSWHQTNIHHKKTKTKASAAGILELNSILSQKVTENKR